MNPQNDKILDYYVVPGSEKLQRLMYCGLNSTVLDLYRFADLSILQTIIRRTHLMEET